MSNATKMRRTQSRALPWFGADTLVCEQYAALLADCKHVTVPFCGGLSIVAHLVESAGEIVCNDTHSHAINFYAVISNDLFRRQMIETLERMPFSQQLLEQAQEICKRIVPRTTWPDVDLATQYFVTCWMGRSGKAGTKSEFNGGLAMRWDAGGGSSPLRFQTAVRSIQEFWGPICERCSFVCLKWPQIIAKVKDDPKCGIYADPPWVGAGDDYVHQFDSTAHRYLCEALSAFTKAKVVIRYVDDELIRKFYGGRPQWHIREVTSRDQANGGVKELCITNFAEDTQ
jgi:site-specific DNA-adenine methylase